MLVQGAEPPGTPTEVGACAGWPTASCVGPAALVQGAEPPGTPTRWVPFGWLVDASCRRAPDPSEHKRHPVASKSTDIRPKITMACTECKERNYITRKNRRNDPDRLELKKFCPRCRTHRAHRETR